MKNFLLKNKPISNGKVCMLVSLILALSFSEVSAQLWPEYSKLYYDDPAFFEQPLSKSNETVLLSFDDLNGTNYPSGRTLMIRSVNDNFSGVNNALMITLLDENGIELYGNSEIIHGPYDLIPVAAAYNDGRNSGMPTYVVTGYTNTGVIWYLSFDKDISTFNFQELNSGDRMFVTDICASYQSTNGNDPDFAMTGKMESVHTASNAYDALYASNSEIFVMEISTVSNSVSDVFTPDMDAPSAPVSNDQKAFPAAIIEIPGAPNGLGYFVSGTILNSKSNPLFYMRCDYPNPANVTNYNVYSILYPLNATVDLNAQTAFYDPQIDAVCIAGSVSGVPGFGGGFIFDRLDIFGTGPSAPLNPVSSSWLPLNPGLPMLSEMSSSTSSVDIFNSTSFAEGVFKQEWILGSNNSLQHVALRFKETSFNANDDIPAMLELDYDPAFTFRPSWWGANNTIPFVHYTRQVPNDLGQHTNDENYHVYQLARSHQAVKKYHWAGGNYWQNYVLGSLGSLTPSNSISNNKTTIMQTDGSPNGFINNCTIGTDFGQTSNLTLRPYQINNNPGRMWPIVTSPMSFNHIGFPAPFWDCQLDGLFKNAPTENNNTDIMVSEMKVWAADNKLRWSNSSTNTFKKIELLNSVGQLVELISGEEIKLFSYDMSSLPSGVYLVRYIDDSNKSKVVKVLNR